MPAGPNGSEAGCVFVPVATGTVAVSIAEGEGETAATVEVRVVVGTGREGEPLPRMKRNAPRASAVNPNTPMLIPRRWSGDPVLNGGMTTGGLSLRIVSRFVLVSTASLKAFASS